MIATLKELSEKVEGPVIETEVGAHAIERFTRGNNGLCNAIGLDSAGALH